MAASPPPPPHDPPIVPSYARAAWLMTVIWSPPSGWAAMREAEAADRRLAAGDIEAARRHANRAWCWLVWSVPIGLVLNAVVVGITVYLGIRVYHWATAWAETVF
jgi:hypothetical protein